MAKVKLQELEAKLSEYVGRTRRGEHFLVTDAGEAVAELIPLSSERRALAKLASQGDIEWQGGKPKGLRGVIVRGELMSETILRDRR